MTALPAVKSTALAPIDEALAGLAEAMSLANTCRHLTEHGGQLESAKTALGQLSLVPAAARTQRQLLDVLAPGPGDEIGFAAAQKMLSVLFATLGKRKADDESSAMMLAACADMFSPASNMISEMIGVKPVSKHPVILALAIKKLLGASVFAPSPAELRAAMAEVKSAISLREAWLCQFLNWMQRADRLVFEFDRPAWEAAYAQLDGSVARAMLRGLIEGPGEDAAPSPRWQALNTIAKQATLAPPMVPA
jgi:hypothetical protein